MKNALYAALLALSVGTHAHATGLETGTILVCDTQKHAVRYGEFFKGNAEAAITAVNREEKDGCGVAEVTYVRGKPIGTLRSKSHTFHVVPVIVVGVTTPNGFQPVDSAVLFTVVEVREHAI